MPDQTRPHLEKVAEFHRKYGLPIGPAPASLGPEDFEFRWRFIAEELAELRVAWLAGDLAEQADALIDLEYVVHGMAIWMGLGDIWGALHDEVHRTNMAKVPAAHADESKRGHSKDVLKPPGWTAPDLKSIIDERIRLVKERP